MFYINFLTQPWANGNGLTSDFKGDIWPWTGTGNSARHEEAIMPAVAIVDLLSNPIWWDRLHRWDERLTPESCSVWCVCVVEWTRCPLLQTHHTHTHVHHAHSSFSFCRTQFQDGEKVAGWAGAYTGHGPILVNGSVTWPARTAI